MFEMTAERLDDLAVGHRDAGDRAVLDDDPLGLLTGLIGNAELLAELAQASATSRVPPIGYQTPSLVCMCAIEQSTAGEANGEEPTY